MDTELFEPLIKSFLGQMDSAMKVSDILASHESSEEITVDHIITGLVYRLMVPMTNEEVTEAVNFEFREELLLNSKVTVCVTFR